jgi:hypothetical protein
MAPAPRCSLLELAHLIDDSLADDPGDVAFAVVDDPVELVLELLPLHAHPCVVLAGLVGPATWRAFGLRVHARAHLLDRPDEGPQPVVTTFVRDRSGGSVSLLRRSGSVTEQVNLAQGRIPDLCRQILPAGPPPSAPP